MNIEETLYSGNLFKEWQMSHAERMAMSHIINIIQPKLAIEVGTFKGGSLSLLTRHCGWIYSLDIDPDVAKNFSSFRNVSFITGRSEKTLPELLTRLEQEEAPLEFILIDGDHSRAGVCSDLNTVLQYRPSKRVHVLLHDSFNSECRAGMLEADWGTARHVSFVDLDFIHGRVIQQGGPFDRQLWGGFALVVLEPEEQTAPPEILGTSSWMQEACNRAFS